MGSANTSRLEIIVEGNSTGGQSAISSVTSGLNEMGNAAQRLNISERLNEARENLARTTRELGESNSVTKEWSSIVQRLEGELSAVGSGAVAAGSAATGALTTVLGIATPVLTVIGGIATAFAGITKAVFDAINANIRWGETVAAIQNATGASAEFASMLGTVGEVGGVTSESIIRMYGQFARNFEAAANQQKVIANEVERAKGEYAERTAALTEQVVERISTIQANAAERANELTQRQAEVEADYQRERAEAERDLSERLTELRRQTNERSEELERRHNETLAGLLEDQSQSTEDYNRRRSDAERDYNERRAELVRASTERIQELERNHTDRLADLAVQLQRVRTDIQQAEFDRQNELARKTLEQAEALAARLGELAQQRAEKIAGLEESEADLRETYAQRQIDAQDRLQARLENQQQKLADQLQRLEESTATKRQSLQDRINNAQDEFDKRAFESELAAFNEQEAKKRAEIQKKSDEEKAAIEKAAADAAAKEEAEFQKKLAKIQDRIDRENKAYEEQTKKLQDEYAKRAQALAAASEAERQRIIQDNTERTVALQNRIDDENAQFTRQTEQIRTELERRTTDLTTQYQRDADEARRSNEQRITDLATRIERENKQYAEQSAKLAADLTRRIDSESVEYQRGADSAKRAYDQQVSDNTEAQAKLLADTQKRVEAEQQAYVKSVAAAADVFNDQLSRANDRLPPVIRALKDIGLEYDNINKLKPDERIAALNDALAKTPDSTKKSNAELVLFGEAGRDVDKIADTMATKTLPEWIKKTDELGKLLDEKTVVALQNTAREQNLSRLEWEKYGRQVATELQPAFDKMLNSFQEFWQTSGPAITKFLKETLVPAFQSLFQVMSDIVQLMSGNGNSFLTGFSNLSNNPVFRTLIGLLPGGSAIGIGGQLAPILGGGTNPTVTPPTGGAVINQYNTYIQDPTRTPADDLRMAQLVTGGTR